MHVIQEHSVRDSVTIRIYDHDELSGYLIVELDGYLDAENAVPCFDFIESQGDMAKGIVFLLNHLRSTNATGVGKFGELIVRNTKNEKYTIFIGLQEHPRPILFDYALERTHFCLSFETLDDFLLHLRTRSD